MHLEAQPYTKKVPGLFGWIPRFWKVSRVSSSSASLAFVLRCGGAQNYGATGDIRDMGEI